MRWLSDISVSDIVQIAILYFVIYSILKAAKGSRFGQVLMGVGLLVVAMITFTYVFHFDVLSKIVWNLLVYLAISTVVIFQPEIRRILSQVGAFGFFEKAKTDPTGAASPEFITMVILHLAERKMGALIAFERGISLRSYEESGIRLNADFSRELVISIFTPPMPLHDGGVTIQGGRIRAAHCVFPVSNNPDFVVSGLRHRAGAGLSEETDAIVVIVSEETGNISIAHNGKLIRCGRDSAKSVLLRWISKAAIADNQRLQQTIFSQVYARLTKFGEFLVRKGTTA